MKHDITSLFAQQLDTFSNAVSLEILLDLDETRRANVFQIAELLRGLASDKPVPSPIIEPAAPLPQAPQQSTAAPRAARKAAVPTSADQTTIDPAWQNEDGTIRTLSRSEISALTNDQRSARRRKQKALYMHRYHAERGATPAAAKTPVLSCAPTNNGTAPIVKRNGLDTNPLASPPAASVDEDIRGRIAQAQATGKRPSCGYF